MTKAKASGSSARRSQVANACQACRTSKVKCSGKHPTCARCTSRGIECSYDVSEEGMTRRQHLRQEYDDQRRELDSAMNILDVLRHGSDHEATETLARIRLGQTLAEANGEIENARNQRSQEDGEGEEEEDEEESMEDEQSVLDSASTHSFDHQGPYPNLDRARASLSTTSAIPPSSYWTQGPPQMPMQAYATSSRRPSQQQQQQYQQQQQQQQQQDFGMMESQNFAWPSPLSSEPQSATSEWSSMGVQQFENFHFDMDGDAQQRPDGDSIGPGSASSFGQERRMH